MGLNDRMLADAGSDLYSTVEFDTAWFSTPRAASFAAEAVEVVRAAYGTDSFIVLKDPRAALMLPVWDRALTAAGYGVVHILPLRHPASVAHSLRRRHLKELPYDAWPRPRGELVWLRYTLAAVRGSRGRPRSFVSYSDVLTDWRTQARRIAAETGIVWPRFGSADREIDAFLHGNERADTAHERDAPPEDRAPETLDYAELAAALYAGLRAGGDTGGLTDRIHDDYARRMAGSRDLIRTLEDLYPLVWRYYEEAQAQRKRIDLAQRSEGTLHDAVQSLWSDLTRTNGEKGTLRQDLTATAERVQSLEAALQETERQRLYNQALYENSRAQHEDCKAAYTDVAGKLEACGVVLRDLERQHDAYDTTIAAITAELDAVTADREAVRHDLEAAHAEATAGLEHALAEEAGRAAGLQARLDGLLSSTSWRWTKPLRFITRLGRR